MVTRTAAESLTALRDGSAWAGELSLADDGTLQAELPDGTWGSLSLAREWVLTRPQAPLYRDARAADGSRVLVHADGSTATFDTSGTLVSLVTSEGAPATQEPDGSWSATHVDGSTATWTAAGVLIGRMSGFADGFTRTLQADGTVRYELHDGLWVEVYGTEVSAGDSSGTLAAARAEDGTVTVTRPGGRLVLQEGQGVREFVTGRFDYATSPKDEGRGLAHEFRWDGQVTTWQPDGSALRVLGAQRTLIARDGAVLDAETDGTYVHTGPDGRTSFYDSDGLFVRSSLEQAGMRHEYLADGGERWTWGNGVVRLRAAEGTEEWTLPDGSTVAVAANHALTAQDDQEAPLTVAWAQDSWRSWQIVLTRGDGSTARVYANGLMLVTSAAGTGPDGLLEIRGPQGTLTTFDAQGVPSTVDGESQPVATVTNADGSVTVAEGGWTLTVWDAQEWSLEAPSGAVQTHDTTGAWTVTLADGLEIAFTATAVVPPAGWSVGNDGLPAADGSLLTLRRNDGPYETYRYLTVRADFSAESWYPSPGTRSVVHADGSQWNSAPGGVETAVASDGTVASTAASVPGLTVAVSSDGTRTVTGSHGLVVQTFADNSEKWIRSDGVTVIVAVRVYGGDHPTRSVQGVYAADGTPLDWQVEREWWGDGRIRLTMPDGTTEYFLPDYRLLRVASNGLERLTAPDGTQTFTLPGGVKLTVTPQGALEARDSEGASLAAAALQQGRFEVTDAQGIRLTVSPDMSYTLRRGDRAVLYRVDGSSSWTVDDGTRVERFAHGGIQAGGTDSLGYAWNDGWSPLRADLDTAGNVVLTLFNGNQRTLLNLRDAFGADHLGDPTVVSVEDVSSSAPFPWPAHLGPDPVVRRLVHTDGSETLVDAGGTRTRFTRSGLRLTTAADGTRTWVLPDDTTFVQRPDGSVVTVTTAGPARGRLVDSQGRPLDVKLRTDGLLDLIQEDGTLLRLDTATLSLTTLAPDGSRIAELADGSFTAYGPDGEAEASPAARTHVNADGSVLSRSADGTWTWTFPAGAVAEGTVPTLNADCTWSMTRLNGDRMTYAADGRLSSRLVAATNLLDEYGLNGTRVVTRSASGWALKHLSPTSRELYLPDGTRVELSGGAGELFGGSERARRPLHAYTLAIWTNLQELAVAEHDGTLSWVIGQNGAIQRNREDGTLLEVLHLEGQVDHFDERGTLTHTSLPDGTTVRFLPDGSKATFDPSGILAGVRLGDGGAASLQPDGTWSGTAQDGSTSTFTAAGVPVSRIWTDGRRIDYALDGSRAELAADGVRTDYRADGTRLRQTLADDTVTTYDASGRPASTTYPDGTVTTRSTRSAGTPQEVGVEVFPDGREHLYRTDGTLLRRRLPTGETWLYDGQGHIVFEVDAEGWLSTSTYEADGSRRATRADGQVSEYRPDGSLARTIQTDGTIFEYPADGVRERVSTFLNQVVETRYLDGSRDWQLPQGIHLSKAADGALLAEDSLHEPLPVAEDADGHLTVTRPGGSQVVLGPDGAVEEMSAEGAVLLRLDLDGSRAERMPDGGQRLTDRDGRTETYDAFWRPVSVVEVDGTSTLYGRDGSETSRDAQGSVSSIRLADGTEAVFVPEAGYWKGTDSGGAVHLFRPDGSLLSVVDASGTLISYAADGAWTETSADGSIMVYRPSGQLERYTDAQGNRTYFDAAGTPTHLEKASGEVTWFRADGTPERTQRTDGTVDHHQADGSTRRLDAQGQLLQIVTENGATRAVLQGDGTWRGEQPDGTVFRFRADGKPLERSGADDTVTAYALDGTVTTTRPDGTVITRLADGTTTVQPLAGGPTIYHADGRVEVHRSDDTTFLTLLDGSTETRYPDGTRIVEGPDGTITTWLPGGSLVTRDRYGRVFRQADAEAPREQLSAEGTLVENLGAGLTLTWSAPGTMRIARMGYSTRELHPGGRVTETAVDDTVTVWHVSGATEVRHPDGNREYTHVDGTRVLLGSDGSLTTWLPDGSRLSRVSSFTPTVFDPADGSTAVRNADGSVSLGGEGAATWTWLPDGRLQVAYGEDVTAWALDGTVQETRSGGSSTTDPDGTRVTVDAENVRTTQSFDGSWSTTKPDGSGQTRFVDGATRKWDADGTRYDLAPDGKTLTVTLTDGSVVVRAADGSVHPTPAPASTILIHGACGHWKASLSDGTMLMWGDEGTLVTTSPDGKVVRQALSGSLVVETPDGTRWVRTPEGRVSQTKADGTVTVQTPDGARFAALTDGRLQTVGLDGLTRRADTDGTLWTWHDDGSTERQRADGTNTLWQADGSRVETLSGGVTIRHEWAGPSTYRFQDGSLVTVAVDGTLVPQIAVGSTTVRLETDGTVVATMPNSGELRLAPGGERRLTSADGSLSVRMQDGTFSTTAAGVTTTWSPDGSVTRQEGARRSVWEADTGRTLTYQDGHLVELVEANGIRDEYLPGGNVRTTFPTVGSNPPVVMINGRTPLIQVVPHGERTLPVMPTRPVLPEEPELQAQLAEAYKAGHRLFALRTSMDSVTGLPVRALAFGPAFQAVMTFFSTAHTTHVASDGGAVDGPPQPVPPRTGGTGGTGDNDPPGRWEVTVLHKARCCADTDCTCGCRAGIPADAAQDADPTEEHRYTINFAEEEGYEDLGSVPVTDPETGEETGKMIWTFRVRGQLYWSDAPPNKRPTDNGIDLPQGGAILVAWEHPEQPDSSGPSGSIPEDEVWDDILIAQAPGSQAIAQSAIVARLTPTSFFMPNRLPNGDWATEWPLDSAASNQLNQFQHDRANNPGIQWSFRRVSFEIEAQLKSIDDTFSSSWSTAAHWLRGGLIRSRSKCYGPLEAPAQPTSIIGKTSAYTCQTTSSLSLPDSHPTPMQHIGSRPGFLTGQSPRLQRPGKLVATSS